MANIHVSPLASPSLECLSPAELTNEESGQVEQVTPNQDENENDVFKGETKAFGRKKGFCRLILKIFLGLAWLAGYSRFLVQF